MSAYRLGAARLAAAVTMAALLVACGQSSFTSRATPTPTPSPEQNAAPPADETPDSDAALVSAVGPPGPSSLISVKFRVEARPVVGMPVKIELALIPAANAQINRIHGSFLVGSGLLLQSEHSFDVPTVQAGVTLYRELTVVPQQSGVLSLNATILIQQDIGSQARTYSIPLIATDSST
jgi:hypothetical protein